MIAAAIAHYLKDNGIKQAFLCRQTGLSKHCISNALNGKRRLSVDEYEKICTALDVPYAYFFERREKSEWDAICDGKIFQG